MNWLLLRGLVRERRHWGEFPDRLAARTGGTVLCLDLPGVGTERDRLSPTSLLAIVDDLRSRFQGQRGGSAEWALFAPSLGGMIALTWAEAYPADFMRIAVCNTSTADLGGVFERFSFAALGTVLRALPATVFTPRADPLAREMRTLALVSNTAHGRANTAMFATYARERPIGVSVLVRQLWAASRARTPGAVSVPVLVICSEGDRLCRAVISRRLAERLGAKLAVHPDGGHDLPLDDPDWVVSQLLEAPAGPT